MALLLLSSLGAARLPRNVDPDTLTELCVATATAPPAEHHRNVRLFIACRFLFFWGPCRL